MPKKLLKPETSADEVRPIGARALKSAIDTLRPQLYQASVLDLFAGQGRFGVTSSDEGINDVTFVEKNRKTASELKTWVGGKQFPKTVKASVVCQDVFLFLETLTDKFDVVFADPPFPQWNENFEKKLFSSIVKALKPGAIFLVKYPSRMIPSSQLKELRLVKTSSFGESKLVYFEYESTQG